VLPTAGVPDPAPSAERTDALLTAAERDAFARDGFVAVDRPIVPPEALAEARVLLDELLAAELPEDQVHDLGDAASGSILEVVRATDAQPRLRRTAAFQRCRDLAAELLDVPVAPFYDHVIHKAPRNRAATAWHQDTAYAPGEVFPPTAHVWLALQDVTVATGCMQFVPGSHVREVPHRPRGGDPAAAALEAVGPDTSTAVACPLPAGGVTVHHPGVLHHTGPNDSDGPRLAWILQFREEGTWGVRAWVPRPVRSLLRRRR
jgi:hypothetical protein